VLILSTSQQTIQGRYLQAEKMASEITTNDKIKIKR